MSECNEISNIQGKLKCQIDELEEKIKDTKIYWNQCDASIDKTVVHNFVDCHYNEIIYHIYQIRHHLEQINLHNSELHGMKFNSEQKEVANDQHPNISKRLEADKIRFKNKKSGRSSSMKYVLQWEKIMDEQKEAHTLNLVKRRYKSESSLISANEAEEELKSEDTDVSKIMVKNRVLQFEGIQKPKRVSSTIETFLDFSGEKPKRIGSYPIPEEAEEDDSEEPKSPNRDSVESQDLQIVKPDCTQSSAVNELISNESNAISKIVQEKEKRNLPDVTEIKEETPLTNNKLQKEQTPKNVPAEGLSRKPRIVEVHYKNHSADTLS